MSRFFRTFSAIRPVLFKTNPIIDLKPFTIINTTVLYRPNSTLIPKVKPQLVQGIQDKISSLQLKKRPARKKRTLEEEDLKIKTPGFFDVTAFSTADEYNLEKLLSGLKQEDLYEPKFVDNTDVVHAVAKYQVGDEPRELFFFREGTIVMWNISELEIENILNFIKTFETDAYSESLIQNEAEYMNYRCQNDRKPSLTSNGEILIPPEDNTLEKYTFSNAMALSVKLGCWEASLQRYIDTIEFVTDDLKFGRKIKMSQDDVLRKHGELFALRHVINLSSDLLDTPDFYWDQDQLEVLYSHVCGYFSIAKRTRVMNEKINHCVELIELLSSHLSDKHHVRLEWMIIVLIMVEVGFETLHYVERYLH
ncbi:required for meiotic nuclear division protein 1 homolog [Onthophagus taurus]|uniref:required for meiotic nuclear division protein 1 homolog n=1 Tax=Onthophagus taurus TaxID=166361 RepID=UPI000C20645B|nr:required for meiotic nuclear division protein 1 homolog [Onthophagus taurus]